VFTRRQLLAAGPAVLATAGAAAPLTSCAAAPAAAPAAQAGAAVAGAGVVGAWLKVLGDEIRAEIAGKFVEGANWVFEEAWKAWHEPTVKEAKKQAHEGFGYMSATVYGHVIPGTTLVSFSPDSTADATRDRLGCIRDSGEAIALENWAWKAILAFLRQELGDKEGNDRLHLLQLLVKTLMPHGEAVPGTTPKGTVSWVGYPASDGDVEIVKFADAGKPKVTVTATGYYHQTPGTPTKLTFDLV